MKPQLKNSTQHKANELELAKLPHGLKYTYGESEPAEKIDFAKVGYGMDEESLFYRYVFQSFDYEAMLRVHTIL